MGDFVKFSASYAEYHHNKVNIFLHLIGIPSITISLFAITNSLVLTTFQVKGIDIVVNPGLFLVLLMWVLYPTVEAFIGIFTASVYTYAYYYTLTGFDACWVEFATKYGCSWTPFQFMLYLHIAAWIMQFVGHGVFEGRRPALMDNFFLTAVAPFFVFVEVFCTLGYRSELWKECQKETKGRITRWRKRCEQKDN
eukprot:CAMPEP_0114984600 /NCGR_PEP_ID=MMETSP0216-20121206/7366_1 /TAXON_ID=223996 /ORGANISM="Protocruzia adherens, Strain Boccale" /LENGTH=194 /DNA_ID=CAMNT_0002346753 /DNA_START=39 /DNA_END=623 /DNA_ORIENTATION=+